MNQRRITKVFIANRGEIALRIKRACDTLNIASVLGVSEADKNSFAARQIGLTEVIGPAPARESYLHIDRILQAVKNCGADALHPGYGFLSENADFARRVEEAGLTFIGPNSESIRLLGSKTEARKKVTAAGVPCTPGTSADLGDEGLLLEAERMGFPVLIKAVGGGGGRGMRVVTSKEEMKENLPRARAEVKKYFSSEAIYIEKYIERPRHVEVQLFGDNYGNIVHLGTRDCSTQRRHQKLVEEAPAPFLDEALREEIHRAAVLAAKSVGYRNAGTAEFLVKGDKFYFLEMNTRIQVEHPVTEAVTGVDLVALQLKVAMGERLPFSQDEIKFEGHGIEFRIYAEDPQSNFSPAKGRLTKFFCPKDSAVREDKGYEEGDDVSLHYDALMSKLIVKGKNRADAINKSKEILNAYVIKGVSNTVDFHRWLLDNTLFKRSSSEKGFIDIGFVEREFSSERLVEFKASRIRDPRHEKPIGGAFVKNFYEYKSEKYNTRYTIEVLHREDGFFLAMPVDTTGRKAKKKNCRVSNGLDTVVKSLIQDVLESTPPSEMFED